MTTPHPQLSVEDQEAAHTVARSSALRAGELLKACYSIASNTQCLMASITSALAELNHAHQFCIDALPPRIELEHQEEDWSTKAERNEHELWMKAMAAVEFCATAPDAWSGIKAVSSLASMLGCVVWDIRDDAA